VIERLIGAVEPFGFDQVHGASRDMVIGRDGKAAVRRSAGRYRRAIQGRRRRPERATIMNAACTLRRVPGGAWLVRHSSPALGDVEVSASSREEALTKMRNELQYRSELCPCSGASADTVELRVSEDPGTTERR
jgi:hypothetical protein